jgi:hypothetical protein
MSAPGNSRETIVDQDCRNVRAVSALDTETYRRGPASRIRPAAFRRASLRRSVLFAPPNKMAGSGSSFAVCAVDGRRAACRRVSDFCFEPGGTERFFDKFPAYERFLHTIHTG